jgi:hypothetical protein
MDIGLRISNTQHLLSFVRMVCRLTVLSQQFVAKGKFTSFLFYNVVIERGNPGG